MLIVISVYFARLVRPDRQPSTTVTYFHIGCILADNPPIIKVFLADQCPAMMLLDTGSTHCLISAPIAAKLQTLNELASVRGSTVIRGTRVPLFTLSSVRAGGLVLRHVQLGVVAQQQLTNTAGTPIDGIIGQNVLERLAIEISFGRHQMTIWSPGGLSDAPAQASNFSSATVLPLEKRGPFKQFCVQVGLPRGQRQWLLVDTGAPFSVLLASDNLKPSARGRKHRFLAFSGAAAAVKAPLEFLSLGKTVLKSHTFLWSPT